MMKRILSTILAVCLMCSLTVPSFATSTGDSALQTVKALGIIQGDSSGNLNLGKTVTRAEFAAMLASASVYKGTISEEGSGYSLFRDVKSTYWASEYIRLAIQEGWMTGYTDGTFRPEQAVVLEEACTALLRMLGYDASSLAGSFPQAQLNKASSLGLRDQVSVARGQTLTRQNCVYLFYNLLTAKTSDGQTYAVTLGYTVTNNEVDYVSVVSEGISGPYVAENASNTLPIAASTIYKNGETLSSASLQQYDVYYYSETAGTVWIYTDRASGKIEALSPSSSEPTSVTVAGITYEIGSATASYKLSAMGGGSEGNIVTLLLGMDGAVVDVLTGKDVDAVYYGVVQSSEKVSGSKNQTGINTRVTIAYTDGTIRSFTAAQDTTYSVGRLLSVSVTGGAVTVKGLGSKSISGTVNKDGTKLGDYAFADDIQILDVSGEGDYAVIESARLSGCALRDKKVKFYALNQRNEISHLILDDVTGDTWHYGYMISVDDQSVPGSMQISVTYRYVMDGNTTTLASQTARYPVNSGGLAIRYNSDGSIKTMKNTASVRLTELGLFTARADNKTYDLADDVQIYLRQNGSYYQTNLSSINAKDYTLTGYYDNFGCAAGGQVRIIIAVKNQS